jgi:hypothetical protein
MFAFRTTIQFYNTSEKKVDHLQYTDIAYDAVSAVEWAIKEFQRGYPHTSVMSIDTNIVR